eukprot:GFKZ01012695.1.p1 GENE.GFKZ01012695.1~~GFKZ01012695.1.p1  ORF type:complete len:475 (-),score=70.73 GFKZ01012695.1:134-1558(-)
MGTQSRISVGDYHIIKTLGSGATGKVKLARHPHTDELVALKIIRKDLLHRKRFLYEKVRREIAVMKLLAGSCMVVEQSLEKRADLLPGSLPDGHIGVMKLLDVYDTENSFVLVLEYCDGGELFDLLVENGYLPEPQVLDLFQQLVYALEFCHARGICHRDLKPENVLLMSDGRLKLADFGMASILTPEDLLETSCGSPQYCAPEVIGGQAYEGAPADVWSLGVVLYAMTTGGVPFDDDNLHRLMAKVNSGAFYIPEPVPEDLADVIRSMLRIDPKERATLEEIKKSKWFESQPCRADIYREGVDGNVGWRKIAHDRAIAEPDKEVVKYLRDLGLGEAKIIRRRLTEAGNCIEREFYCQLLHLCGDSLSFQVADDMPPSPTPEMSAGAACGDEGRAEGEILGGGERFVGERMGEMQIGNNRVDRSFAKVMSPPSWFQRLTEAMTVERVPNVIQVLQVDSPTGFAGVDAIQSISSG